MVSECSFKVVFFFQLSYFDLMIITLQYLRWFLPYISMDWPQVYMCTSHPEPPSELPLHPNPLCCPIAPALGAPPMTALALFPFLPSQDYSPPNSHESYQVFPHLKPSRGISSILNAGQGLRGLVSHTSSQIGLLKYLNVAICCWRSRHPRLLPVPRTSHANSTSQMLVTATDAKKIRVATATASDYAKIPHEEFGLSHVTVTFPALLSRLGQDPGTSLLISIGIQNF